MRLQFQVDVSFCFPTGSPIFEEHRRSYRFTPNPKYRIHRRSLATADADYESLHTYIFLFWGLAGPWLARNEGMDPYSSPGVTHSGSFYFLSIPSFPAIQRPVSLGLGPDSLYTGSIGSSRVV